MSLAHVILGLLQQQERTGYDLKTECFNQCVAHLWPADQAQIYRTLDKLEKQDWITCTVEIQQDRPNRKIYCITETGVAELTRWLQTHQPPPIVREPLLAQLHFAAQLPNAAILHLLEQELAARREKLAECEALQNNFSSDTDPALPSDDSVASREQKLRQRVLELMIQREQTNLNWLQNTIDTIANPGNSSIPS
ncbi:PadR family transcriptional regulator [Pseudanabaena sp. FACHB-2040]|uniref:PadR family transcriptional regulator n=1 Tax=Pseudanabaena sp. FACHB-2040 TaxID=2692859 RepID=UPI001683FF4C|nr:PadR family transcriptional regulator [Pseudanabaena sp. FACHB-2040]MBD2256266.1 PadR family transcriptional regulator [Pseudanabaena sp. FACHB-2040]